MDGKASERANLDLQLNIMQRLEVQPVQPACTANKMPAERYQSTPAFPQNDEMFESGLAWGCSKVACKVG